MTEEDILRSIRQGGRARDAALKALYDGTAQHMLRFFVYRGVSGDEAQDILQETFVKIVRNADTFNGSGAARAWIWQVARNCFTDFMRKRSRLSEDEVAVNDEKWQALEETTAAPPDCVPGQSVETCVASGLEAFASQNPERAAALMLHMDGMSMAEISERIGRTVAATKEYLSQCRKKIQHFIAHCTELLAT